MAEGGEINIRLLGEDGYDEDGYDEDGYDEYGYDKNGNDKDGNVGYNEDGYDKYGFDKYGYDKDGKMFEQGKGEHIPLLARTSTSNTRETQRPFRPRVRTSTRKEVSFANPSYHVTDGDEMESGYDINKMLHLSDLREKFKNGLRADVKRLFPRMTKAVQVNEIDGRLSVKLFGEEKWSSVYNKNGKLSLQFNKDLKKALGFKRDDILKANDEQNLEDLTRLEELENDLDREDISEEVKNTTRNEINELKEGIAERNKENEAIQNQTSK